MKTSGKFIFLVPLLALVCFEASARFGIGGGYMFSANQTKMNGEKKTESLSTNGFYVGVYRDMNIIGEAFSLRPGLYYQHLLRTEDIQSPLPNFKITNTYLDNFLGIPVHLKGAVNLLPGILKLYVFAGPTFEVGLSSRDQLSIRGNNAIDDMVDGKITYNYYTRKVKSSSLSNSQSEIYDDYLPSEAHYRRFDIMMGGGIGLEIVRFIDFKIGYDYGLVNRFKGDLADAGKVNREQFYVGLAVRF